MLVSAPVWRRHVLLFLSAGTLNGSNCLSRFLIWSPPASNPCTLCLLCTFIKSVLNCERPAKCIPLTDDRLEGKKKKRINTSRVCLLPVSSTDYLRTIRLHGAFFWSWLCPYRAPGECGGCSVSEQERSRRPGQGTTRTRPNIHKYTGNHRTQRLSLQNTEGFSQESEMRAARSGDALCHPPSSP